MRVTTLGRSGLRVSTVALGTMRFGTGPIALRAGAAREIFEAFVTAGGTTFDTAPVYGADGSAESMLGPLLGDFRDRFVVISKVGARTDPAGPSSAGLSRRAILRGVEASLRRLGTDYLDVVLVHAHDPHTDVARWVDTLSALVTRGLTSSWGVSNVPAWVLAEAATRGALHGVPPDAAQVRYSVIDRDAEHELLPAAERFGLGVTAWAPLGGGVLARYPLGGGSTLARRGYRPSDEDDRDARTLAGIAAQAGVRPAQAALAWLVSRGVIPVVGASTADQMRELVAVPRLEDPVMTLLDRLRPPVARYPQAFLAQAREFFLGPWPDAD